VQNVQSNKTIVATVVGHNRVAIGPSQIALSTPPQQ
jgi:hypothetical protein